MKLIFIFCAVALFLSSQTFAYDNRPIIVLREDDGWVNCRDVFPEFGNKSFLQYAKELEMPITWGVISDRPSAGTSLSWAEFIDYVTKPDGGQLGELASHSAAHKPLNSLQAYIDDLLRSKAAIQSNTLFACNTFIQPGPWKDDANIDSFSKLDNALGKAIQSNFSQSMAWAMQYSYMGTPAFRYADDASYWIDYINRPVTSDLLKAINFVSQTPGYIYVIGFHGIQSPTNTIDYSVRADLMAALLTRLAELRAAGLIRIASLNDAFNNNQMSPDINRILDPGFELYTPGIDGYVNRWLIKDGDTFVDNVGYNGSKCCRIIPGGTLQQRFSIPPGRYKLTWMQKPDIGTALNKGISLNIWTKNTNSDTGTTLAWISSPNEIKNTTNDWEQKTIILKNPAQAFATYFYFYATGPFLFDNVSLQLASTDAVECVSNFKATPTPSGIQLSWKSPDNSLYKTIKLRYSQNLGWPQNCSWPQTITAGTRITDITAISGQQQSFFFPFDWNGKGDIYISAFAVKGDGITYSEPDVDVVQVDLAKPVVSNLTVKVVNMNEVATWQVKAKTSDIYATKYSVGTKQLESDIVDWTEDDNGSVVLGHLNPKFYVNVQTQNVFGIWSDPVSVQIADNGTQNPETLADGMPVTTEGVVSAIFNGYYYIQFPDKLRGIKVVGTTTSLSLGMTVVVEGVLKTEFGERYIAQTP